MRVALSEYSAGFSDYSWILCNELISYVDNLVYLTEKNNIYVHDINKKVEIYQLFDSFIADKNHKKGSLAWVYNRVVTTLRNCILRNGFIKEYKPDVTLIQATLSTFDKYFLKGLKRYTKVILIVHDVIVPTRSLSWNKKSLKKTYELADSLVVHSETNKKQLSAMFGVNLDKINVIPHGIRSTYNKIDKNFCRMKLGINENESVFLFYGSLRKSKGLDVLIKAMKGIKALLIIAGAPFYGETFDEYRTLIDENNVKTMEFIEYTEDSFRDILFQASDYMILPYKEFYSQSGVFMQSIQYHLPVIATDVSAFKEYIDKYKIGYICKPNDIDSLHNVLVEVQNKKSQHTFSMEKAIRENSWENASRMYYELMQKMKGIK